MASSAIAGFRMLLKEVASGLTKTDADAMAFTLGFPASTGINSGTHLLQEMEKQDRLGEDNLEELKSLLQAYDYKRLVKKVTEYEAAKEDPLSKTWPTSTFNQQNAPPADKRRAHSVATDPAISAQAVPPFPAGYVPMQPYYPDVAPPSYQGHIRLRQHQDQPYLQQPQPRYMQDRYTANRPVQMAPSYYPGPQTSTQYGYHQGLGTTADSGQQMPDNQQDLENTIRQLEEQLRLQKLQNYSGNQAPAAAQHTGLPGTHPNVGAQYAPAPRLRVRSDPPPQAQFQGHLSDGAPPPGHAKVSAVKSAPGTTSAAGPNPQDFSPTFTELSEAPRSRPETGTHSWNIPLENGALEGVAKVNGQQTEKGNVVSGTSSIQGRLASNELKKYSAANTCVAATGAYMYQTGRVRVDSGDNNLDSTTVAATPISTQSMGSATERRLISEYGGGQQLYDHSRVDLFENGPYQVKISEGCHVVTTEGGHVILPFGTNYTIKLVNNDPVLRCSAEVTYNGRFAGDWTVDPRGSVVVERPVTEGAKFCFIDPGCAPAGSGVTDGDPENGLVRAVFTPEKNKSEPRNDIPRGFGNLGSHPEGDYFGADGTIQFADDVQRGVIGPPHPGWQPGATILHGPSSQKFSASEHFDLDVSLRRVIEFKLVGKR